MKYLKKIFINPHYEIDETFLLREGDVYDATEAILWDLRQFSFGALFLFQNSVINVVGSGSVIMGNLLALFRQSQLKTGFDLSTNNFGCQPNVATSCSHGNI